VKYVFRKMIIDRRGADVILQENRSQSCEVCFMVGLCKGRGRQQNREDNERENPAYHSLDFESNGNKFPLTVMAQEGVRTGPLHQPVRRAKPGRIPSPSLRNVLPVYYGHTFYPFLEDRLAIEAGRRLLNKVIYRSYVHRGSRIARLLPDGSNRSVLPKMIPISFPFHGTQCIIIRVQIVGNCLIDVVVHQARVGCRLASLTCREGRKQEKCGDFHNLRTIAKIRIFTHMKNPHHVELLRLIKEYAGEARIDPLLGHYIGNAHPVYAIRAPQLRTIARNWMAQHRDLTPKQLEALLSSLVKGRSATEKMLAGVLLDYARKEQRAINPRCFDEWLDHVEGWAEVDALCTNKYTVR